MTAIRWMCAALCVGLFTLFAFSCGDTACTPDSCSGCCDESGLCQPGNEAAACGAGADACVSCGDEACETGGVCHWTVVVQGPTEYEPGEDPDGPASEDDAAIDRFCDGQVEVTCAYLVRCGYAQTQEDCEDRWARGAEGTTCGLNEKAAVKAGHAVFREDNAIACLERIRSEVACRPFADGLAISGGPCDELLDRTDDTLGCFGQSECGPAAYCTAELQTCPGSCVAKKAEGEAAPSDDACEAGLFLYQGVCTAPLTTQGATCQSLSGPSRRCADGMYCSANGCEPYLAEDEVCPDSTCVCAPGLTLEDNLCRPLKSAGDPCGTGATCKLDLLCLNGTCTATVDQGAACSSSGECDAGLRCAAGQCAPRLEEGADGCQEHLDCRPGLHCDPQATCVANLGEGEACQSGDACGPGLDCEDIQATTGHGTCQPSLCLADVQ